MTTEPMAPATGARRGILGWIGSTLPTVLALCGLFGTAWWGHHTDWTFGWSVDGSESDSRANSGGCLPHGWPQGECAACRLGR